MNASGNILNHLVDPTTSASTPLSETSSIDAPSSVMSTVDFKTATELITFHDQSIPNTSFETDVQRVRLRRTSSNPEISAGSVRLQRTLTNAKERLGRILSSMSMLKRRVVKLTPVVYENPYYEAESPDELALVYAAAGYGMRLVKRHATYAKLELPSNIHWIQFVT